MNPKILGVIGIIIITGIIVASIYQTSPEEQKQSKLDLILETAEIELERIQNSNNVYLTTSEHSGLFHIYVYKHQVQLNSDGVKKPEIMHFIPKKELEKTYEKIGLFNEPQNTVVIIPTFTANAYKVPGFYNYHDGSCDKRCLTVSIQNRTSGFTSSDNGVKILKILQYEMLTDVDVDKNPSILKKYDKVILLHNEYVTKKQFDVITNHPNVIYLYPNALYAEVESEYENNTITLKRGHNYPESSITNGFDWEYDNSPMEYDDGCSDWKFYKINNGWVLNCYPENTLLLNSEEFLKQVKRF